MDGEYGQGVSATAADGSTFPRFTATACKPRHVAGAPRHAAPRTVAESRTTASGCLPDFPRTGASRGAAAAWSDVSGGYCP